MPLTSSRNIQLGPGHASAPSFEPNLLLLPNTYRLSTEKKTSRLNCYHYVPKSDLERNLKDEQRCHGRNVVAPNKKKNRPKEDRRFSTTMPRRHDINFGGLVWEPSTCGAVL